MKSKICAKIMAWNIVFWATHFAFAGDLSIVGSADNYPCLFMNSSSPAGLWVDFIENFSSINNLKYKIIFIPEERIPYFITTAKPDIILSCRNRTSFDGYYSVRDFFKIPYLFVTKDNKSFSLEDINNKRVVVSGNRLHYECLSDIIRKFNPGSVIFIEDVDSALSLIYNRAYDTALIPSYLVSDDLITKYGLTLSDYVSVAVSHSLLVRDDNEQLKQALIDFTRTYGKEKIERLYMKWILPNNEKALTGNYAIALKTGTVALVLFFVFLFINNIVLGRRVSDETLSLMERISILEKNLMEISQRENLYRRIFERAITPILVLDHSGNVVFMNFLARKLLGVESEKVIFNILKDPNSSDWFCKKYKGTSTFSFEALYSFDKLVESGLLNSSRRGEAFFSFLFIPLKSIGFHEEKIYICYIEDKTEFQELARYKKETALRYELIFDSVRDGLCEWNLRDDIIKPNKRLISMLGYRFSIFPGKWSMLMELVEPSLREEVYLSLQERIKSGRSFCCELKLKRFDGSWVWLLAKGDVVEWDHDLSPVRVIAVFQDISAFKKDSNFLFDSAQNSISFFTERGRSLAYIPDGKRVLIVDDNSLITLHLSELLRRNGILPIIANSGNEAIDIFCNSCEKFDFVILDLEMPDLSGYEVIRVVRDIDKNVPVIASTGHVDVAITEELHRYGFTDYINKPIEEGLLMEKILRYIDASREI